ncbi:hypothetical protein K474DRAFT_1112236 [Panus rudis PR-1116 ss-1]|nr:hypothetical protein K474DRAFT_1112236 [Panus rudis PR-1116 ss-1]
MAPTVAPPTPQESEDDWVVLPEDWWRHSYRHEPWAYRRKKQWTSTGARTAIHPRPPYYHDQLYAEKDDAADRTPAAGEDVELNTDLAGVKAALEVISVYEENAGMNGPLSQMSPDSFPYVPRNRGRLLFGGELTETDVAVAQQSWDDKVRNVFNGRLKRAMYTLAEDEELPKLWDLDLDEDPIYSDVVDLTFSEPSTDSDPTPPTPHADKKSYAEVVFDERIPTLSTVLAPSPSKPLNASALSFIPSTIGAPHIRLTPSPEAEADPHSSKSIYTSPTYEFHFPSLNPTVNNTNTTATASSRTGEPASTSRAETRSLPPNLRKDEQGFYTEISSSPSPAVRSQTSTRTATPRRPSYNTSTSTGGSHIGTSALLPAFLADSAGSARTKQSKTREIVDRLRNAGDNRKVKKALASVAASSKSKSTVDADDTERGAEAPVKEEAKEKEKEKEKEKRKVDLSIEADKMAAIDGWITNIENEAMAREAAAAAASGTFCNQDGWIEVPSTSSTSPASSSTSSKPRSQNQYQTNGKKSSKTHKRSVSSASGFTTSTPSSSVSVSSFPSPASSMTSFGLPVTPTSNASFSTSSAHTHTQAMYPYAHAQSTSAAAAAYGTLASCNPHNSASSTTTTSASAAYTAQAQAYVQMQMHLAAAQQWQSYMAAASASGMYPSYYHPAAAAAYGGGVTHPHPSSVQAYAAGYEGKITGMSGIRHV